MTDPAAPAPELLSPRAAARAAKVAFASEVQMRTLRALDAELQALEAEPRDETRLGKLETIARSVDRTSRSLRLTLAMEERSELDREVRIRQALAAAEKKAAERAEDLRDRKRAHLGVALKQAVAASKDKDAMYRRESRLARVERLVERESIERDLFLARPLRETLNRLCQEMGMIVPPGVWREVDWGEVDPPAADPPAPPAIGLSVAPASGPSQAPVPRFKAPTRGAQAPPPG